MTNDLGFVILSTTKDPQYSTTNLTFSTPVLFVLRWFWVLHFVQDDKRFGFCHPEYNGGSAT